VVLGVRSTRVASFVLVAHSLPEQQVMEALCAIRETPDHERGGPIG
jgi:hypothetical protein